jgi:hypothetical protein
MDYPLDESKPLPYAPGDGPFRIKGTVYLGHLEYVAKNVAGGIEAMNNAFRDPRLARFFRQRFLSSSWYDIVPIITSAHTCARLTGVVVAEFLRVRTIMQAKRDLGGIYRLLLKLTSPAAVVTRYATVQAQYFSFGRASARSLGPTRAAVVRSDVPAMFASWFEPVNQAFLEFALGAAGAKRVVTATHPPEPCGQTQGVDAVNLVCEVSWGDT